MTIVIEQINGAWPEWALAAVRNVLGENHFPIAGIDEQGILDALASVPGGKSLTKEQLTDELVKQLARASAWSSEDVRRAIGNALEAFSVPAESVSQP